MGRWGLCGDFVPLSPLFRGDCLHASLSSSSIVATPDFDFVHTHFFKPPNSSLCIPLVIIMWLTSYFPGNATDSLGFASRRKR